MKYARDRHVHLDPTILALRRQMIPWPRPVAGFRERRALYARLDDPTPADTIRDRIGLRIGYYPSRAQVGALAQMTLGGWVAEIHISAREDSHTQRQFRYELSVEGLKSLDDVVEMASSEPEFASELAAAKLMLERVADFAINGVLVPHHYFLTGLTKAVGLYSQDLFGISIWQGGTFARSRKDACAMLQNLRHGALP